MSDKFWTEDEILDRDALIIARARGMIKAHRATSNGILYCDLFGTGMGTARERCRNLGLDPDSNETSYSDMVENMLRIKTQLSDVIIVGDPDTPQQPERK